LESSPAPPRGNGKRHRHAREHRDLVVIERERRRGGGDCGTPVDDAGQIRGFEIRRRQRGDGSQAEILSAPGQGLRLLDRVGADMGDDFDAMRLPGLGPRVVQPQLLITRQRVAFAGSSGHKDRRDLLSGEEGRVCRNDFGGQRSVSMKRGKRGGNESVQWTSQFHRMNRMAR
jgi:hypothetical protein